MNSADIEARAKLILDEIGLNVLPIDLQKIADHYEITISEAPNDDNLSGLLLRSNGKTIVGTNSLHSSNRQRFTIAHELGHYFLHTTQDTFVDDQVNLEFVKFRHKSLPHSSEERDANSFAAALLMPAELISNHFHALKEVVDDIDELLGLLAKKCGVSTEAMRYRLMNLSLIQHS